jgi:hypothetical protein
LTQQKKARKVGRPKLPKGEAKGRIVPVRFRREDLKTIEATAKTKMQTVSEWIRTVLPIEVRYKGYIIELATRTAKEGGYMARGWITRENHRFKPVPVVAPGPHLTREAALEAGIAWSKEKIDLRPPESLEHD